eukprot:COSAG01_NODE_2037_length_8579_cov_119.860849_11_plen_130_part_00
MTSSSLPGGVRLAAPFALDAKPAAAPHSPFFGLPLAEQSSATGYSGVNSYPGMSFGLGVAIVEEPEVAGLHKAAVGTAWWQGIMNTFLAFNPRTGVGCLMLSQTGFCTMHQQAIADVINASCEYVCKDS